ncbi:MAG: alpha/beta fold hydrolase [Proteobacteria bacterium]|nr:alpha/beta fold hydrolase [Pseudomonadota bacterium]
MTTGRSLRALILHGFTGSPSTVDALAPMCAARDLEYAIPTLRGHGTVPEDLLGVTWRDWYEDGERAFEALAADDARVLVMGLSMGGLVALDLASRHRERVAGVVTIAGALELSSPLLPLLSLIAPFKTWWKGAPEAHMPGESATYARFPLSGVRTLLDYQKVVRGRLSEVTAPILAVQTWNDATVRPRSARAILEGVSSRDRELARFSRSAHDMLTGCERDAVVARIGAWVDARLPAWWVAHA